MLFFHLLLIVFKCMLGEYSQLDLVGRLFLQIQGNQWGPSGRDKVFRFNLFFFLINSNAYCTEKRYEVYLKLLSKYIKD